MAQIIQDQNIISLFEDKTKETDESNQIDFGDKKEITNPEIINAFEKEVEGSTIKGSIVKATGAISDFFSGTKKTEFADMPEIGEYSGEGAGVVAVGTLINSNQKAQAQIIQAQIPGSEIFKDKFENLIVTMPDGQSFYLNKPGASLQDFTQTTAQILAYIPGYSMAVKAAGKSLIKKAAYAGIAGTSTSLAQDFGTMPLGSNEIDTTRAVISGIVPIAFEGALAPGLSFVWKKIMGNPSFTKTVKEMVDGEEVTKVVLNKRGEKAAQAAGIDTTKIDENFIKDFSKRLLEGADKKIAGVQAGSKTKFDFELSTAQATGDLEGMALLLEASKGTFGKDAQKQAFNFLQKQGIDIEQSAVNLINRFNKGEISIESLDDAGQNIIQGLQKKYTVASDKVTTAYNLIDKDGIFQAEKSNIDTLIASVKTSIDNATAIKDSVLTPATLRAEKVIRDFAKKYKPQKKPPKFFISPVKIKKIKPAIFNDFIVIKRKLDALYKTASNNTDRKNVKAVIKEWVKFADDNVDNILFSADKGGIKALKTANKLARKKFELYDINNIKVNGLTLNDKAGKVVMKILHDPEINPAKTLDYIFGRATIGKLNDSLTILKRLKTIFGVEGKELQKAASSNKDFQSLRQAAWDRLIRDSSKNGKFNSRTLYNSWKTLTQKNKNLLDELYEPKELSLIDEFVDEIYKTFPQNANSSNTASALARIVQFVGRGLAGIIGFKAFNIQGLILARGMADRARDVISQKAAGKLVDQQLKTSAGRTLNLKSDIAATVKTNAALENSRKRSAYELPTELRPGNQSSLQTTGVNPASFDNKIMAQDANGLTQSEQAFLDDEEKAMRLRSRGMTA